MIMYDIDNNITSNNNNISCCSGSNSNSSSNSGDGSKNADRIPSINDIELLKVGRHFRLSPHVKLVVGRNKDENEVMLALAEQTDAVLEAKDYVGPTCILRGKIDDGAISGAASIALRYSDAPKDKDARSAVRVQVGGVEREIICSPAGNDWIESIRI